MKTIDVYKIAYVKESDFNYSESVTSSEQVALIAREYLKNMAEEYMILLTLDTKRHVTGLSEISHGCLNSSIVHPREVFKRALLNNASSIIVCHNHVSGDVAPSDEDIEVTKKLCAAGKIIGIPLMDHIIIGDNAELSLRAMGYVN